MFLTEFLLTPLIILHLVGQLALVLGSDQVGPGVLDQPQLPELQLLSGLVVSQQHGTLEILLSLTFIQVLQGQIKT